MEVDPCDWCRSANERWFYSTSCYHRSNRRCCSSCSNCVSADTSFRVASAVDMCSTTEPQVAGSSKEPDTFRLRQRHIVGKGCWTSFLVRTAQLQALPSSDIRPTCSVQEVKIGSSSLSCLFATWRAAVRLSKKWTPLHCFSSSTPLAQFHINHNSPPPTGNSRDTTLKTVCDQLDPIGILNPNLLLFQWT